MSLSNNLCQRFEQYGLQADITFEASEEPTCFSKYDDEEDFPSIYTIIYFDKKAKINGKKVSFYCKMVKIGNHTLKTAKQNLSNGCFRYIDRT